MPLDTRAILKDIQVSPAGDRIKVGAKEYSTEEFIQIVEYFMTSVDLRFGDPRLDLVRYISSLTLVPGWNGGNSLRFGARKANYTESNE